MKKILSFILIMSIMVLASCGAQAENGIYIEYLALNVGEEVFLPVDNEEEWSCDVSDIVTYEKTGNGYIKVTGLKEGTTELSKKNYKMIYRIGVRNKVNTPSFSVAEENIFINLSEDRFHKVKINNVDESKIADQLSFEITDKKLASVSAEGVIKGRKNGITEIKITDRKSGYFRIMNVIINGKLGNIYEEQYKTGPSGTRYHVQGAASDYYGDYFYFSFTDRIIKMNSEGEIVASVINLGGHTGDCAYDYENDKLIVSWLKEVDFSGEATTKPEDLKVSYFLVIDAKKLNRMDMEPSDDFMSAVHVSDAIGQFSNINGFDKDGNELPDKYRAIGGRFGVSDAIDSVTIGPKFGDNKNGKMYVTFGISCPGMNTVLNIKDENGNIMNSVKATDRVDNDYLVLAQIELKNFYSFAGKYSERETIQSIPDFDNICFYYFGFHDYGIQTIVYDENKNVYILGSYAVGNRSKFPNFTMFTIDASYVEQEELKGNPGIKGNVVKSKCGQRDSVSGVCGNYNGFCTGLISMHDGYFYGVSVYNDVSNQAAAQLDLYKWNLEEKEYFSGKSPFLKI